MSNDVRWALGGLAVVSAACMLMTWHTATASLVQRIALYICAGAAVYVDRQAGGALEHLGVGEEALFCALVIAIVIRFRLAGDRGFRITPLDVLVIFAAIAVPNLPGALDAPHAGLAIVKLIALLYGLESLLNASGGLWRLPCAIGVGFATLALIA